MDIPYFLNTYPMENNFCQVNIFDTKVKLD